jgi:hypothetical protein
MAAVISLAARFLGAVAGIGPIGLCAMMPETWAMTPAGVAVAQFSKYGPAKFQGNRYDFEDDPPP